MSFAIKKLSKTLFNHLRIRALAPNPLCFLLTVLTGLFLSSSIYAQTPSTTQKGGTGALGSGGVSQKDEELRGLLNARRPGRTENRESVATQRINAHFANLPPLVLPCEDQKIIYHPEFIKYMPQEVRTDLQKLRTEISSYTVRREEARKALSSVRDQLMLSGYNYFRAKETGSSQEVIESEWAFRYQQGVWYWHLFHVTNREGIVRNDTKAYYDLVLPYFSRISISEQQKYLDAWQDRLDCLTKERKDVFKKVFVSEKVQLSEVYEHATDTSVKNANLTSGLAASTARQTSNRRIYAWLVAESSNLTSLLRKLTNRHQLILENTLLHPKIEKAFLTLGAKLGPDDVIPRTPEIREIQLKISKYRSRLLINHLYLKQIEAEATYKNQLNLYTGTVFGLARIGEDTQKAWKNIWKTKNIISYSDYRSMPLNLAVLSVVGTGVEFFGSTFSVVVTDPISDFITSISQPFGKAAGYDLKTSADKAFEQYEKQSRELLRMQRLIELMVKNQDPSKGSSAIKHAESLIEFIKTGKPSARSVTSQAPLTIKSLLEDEGFINATGGGLAYALAPMCASTRDCNALYLHTGRHALTGNARSAWLRIALDRGIEIENPDAPFSKQSLNKKTLADYTPQGDSYISYFQRQVVKHSGKLVYSIPLYGQYRQAYDKIPAVRSLLRYEGKNEASQDVFLQSLITQQDRYTRVLTALAQSSYDFKKLQLENWGAYVEHIRLLTESAEYASAYINSRLVHWGRQKLFISAKNTDKRTGKLSSNGKAQLVFLDTAQQLETTQLASRAAYLKVVHNTLSINYLTVANQLKFLQNAENMRLEAVGFKGRVDLTASIQKFEREARLSELTVVYQNLFQELAVDMVLEYMTAGIANAIISKLPGRWGISKVVFDKNLGNELLESINPWANKFTASGAWDVVQNGATGSVANTAAQIAVKHQNLLSEQHLNTLFEKTLSIGVDAISKVHQSYHRSTIEAQALREQVVLRLAELEKHADPLKDVINNDNKLLQQLVLASINNNETEIARLQNLAVEQARKSVLDGNRARYKVLMDSVQDSYQESLKIDIEMNNGLASLAAGESLRARYLNLLAQKNASDNQPALEQTAAVSALVDFQQLLHSGVPTSTDFQRLVDPNHPLSLSSQIFKKGLNIDLIRKGLKSAIKHAEANNNVNEIKSLKQNAKDIDAIRIKLVNQNLKNLFERYPLLKNQVHAVVQGGAAEGNPEYQGIWGDIDFTILTREGADDSFVKKALEQFFKQQNYALASKDNGGYSSMDTEAFAQPAGRFDSSTESFKSVVEDVAIKIGDPTRFYSEGGGKWFLNNLAFSGLLLWGEMPDSQKWVRMSRSEAHGLAVDMTRYMDFLTDPEYHSATIEKITDPIEKSRKLNYVLAKTKYFIRLIDAYIISTEQGNQLYNDKRLNRKKSAGENASYHHQIAVDAKTLINNPTLNTIFKEGDLEIIQAMAKMKMKGENPTPLDVIGNDKAGLENGVAMLARMETMAAEILASTAQTYHNETTKIIRTGTKEERQAARADVHRKMSTLKKTSDTNSFGSGALMTQKLTAFEGKPLILNEANHKDAINNKILEYRKKRQKLNNNLKQQIDVLIAKQPANDPEGRRTREEISKKIRRSLSASLEVEEQDQGDLAGWYQYSLNLADQLVHGF